MYNNLEEISKVFDEQGHEFAAINAWFSNTNNAGLPMMEKNLHLSNPTHHLSVGAL